MIILHIPNTYAYDESLHHGIEFNTLTECEIDDSLITSPNGLINEGCVNLINTIYGYERDTYSYFSKKLIYSFNISESVVSSINVYLDEVIVDSISIIDNTFTHTNPNIYLNDYISGKPIAWIMSYRFTFDVVDGCKRDRKEYEYYYFEQALLTPIFKASVIDYNETFFLTVTLEELITDSLITSLVEVKDYYGNIITDCFIYSKTDDGYIVGGLYNNWLALRDVKVIVDEAIGYGSYDVKVPYDYIYLKKDYINDCVYSIGDYQDIVIETDFFDYQFSNDIYDVIVYFYLDSNSVVIDKSKMYLYDADSPLIEVSDVKTRLDNLYTLDDLMKLVNVYDRSDVTIEILDIDGYQEAQSPGSYTIGVTATDSDGNSSYKEFNYYVSYGRNSSYTIYTTKASPLTKSDVMSYLTEKELIDKDSIVKITSDYFDNEYKVGAYGISVSIDGCEYNYKIVVKDTDEIKTNGGILSDFEFKPIYFVYLGILFVFLVFVAFMIKKQKERKK